MVASGSNKSSFAMLKIFEKLDPLNPKFITSDGDIHIKNGIEGFQWSGDTPEFLRDLSHIIKNVPKTFKK